MVQDNHSRSSHGIVRGMHFQIDRGAAKLVRCGRGAIFDAIVDVRRGSPTFGQWEGFELTDENARMLYCRSASRTASACSRDVADVFYKQDRYYADATERGIKYDDPDVGVEWPLPVAELKPSQRDADGADAGARSKPTCRSSTWRLSGRRRRAPCSRSSCSRHVRSAGSSSASARGRASTPLSGRSTPPGAIVV